MLWKVGDRVLFAHLLNGPVFVVTSTLQNRWGNFVTVKDMSGEFAEHLFVDAHYDKDSIVPRPTHDADDALGTPKDWRKHG